LSRWVKALVGTMMAIEVPTQSWKRTSSGTPMTRKTSYRTGTMSAPPPMPNSPGGCRDYAGNDQSREQGLAHGHATPCPPEATARTDDQAAAMCAIARPCPQRARATDIWATSVSPQKLQ
jgi:hypothetical protein